MVGFVSLVHFSHCVTTVSLSSSAQAGKSWKAVKFLRVPRFLGVLLILFGIIGGCALMLYLWVRLGPWWHHGD